MCCTETKALSFKKPNIIFLQDDQHRWDALGCANPLVKTPALDSLAADGVRYEQAVCQAPACVPSRYSCMTGLYPSQLGVRRNGEWLTDEQMPLPTIAEHLRDAGYQTAGFGKTHWSAPGCSTRGFETRFIGQDRVKQARLVEEGATMMSDSNQDGIDAYFRETEPYGGGEENVQGYLGRVSAVPAEDHRDGWVTRQCLDFLDSGQDDFRPLFLYLSYLGPHAAFNVPEGFEELYDIGDIPDMETPVGPEDIPLHTKGSDPRMPFFRDASPEVRRRTMLRYWANCSWIDSMFGQVLDKLKETGALDNALIIYLSDHGEMMGDHYYRFTKYCLYEGSVRAPLIVSGTTLPEELRGAVDQRPAELVDVLPTILEAARVPVPDSLPGSSLLSEPNRTGTFSEHHFGPNRSNPSYMWRTESAKLILYPTPPSDGEEANWEECHGDLYDLIVDPRERNNLYDNPESAELRESMTRDLLMRVLQTMKRYPCPDEKTE